MDKTKVRECMGVVGAPLFLVAFFTYGAPLFLAATAGSVYLAGHVKINNKIKKWLEN